MEVVVLEIGTEFSSQSGWREDLNSWDKTALNHSKETKHEQNFGQLFVFSNDENKQHGDKKKNLNQKGDNLSNHGENIDT